MSRLLFRACLVTKNAEGEHRHRNWATVSNDLGQKSLMTDRGIGVELDAVDSTGTGGLDESHFRIQISAASGSQNHRPSRSNPSGHLQTNLTSAAKDENRTGRKIL